MSISDLVAIDSRLQVGSLELGALVDLRLRLDAIYGLMSELVKMERAYQEQGPVFLPIRGQGTSNSSSSPFFINLGGPSELRRWELKSLRIGGVPFTATVAGNALLVKTSSDTTNPGLITGAEVIDQCWNAIPNQAFYGPNEVTVRYPDQIYLYVVSPSASTQYAAGGDVIDTPDTATGKVTA